MWGSGGGPPRCPVGQLIRPLSHFFRRGELHQVRSQLLGTVSSVCPGQAARLATIVDHIVVSLSDPHTRLRSRPIRTGQGVRRRDAPLAWDGKSHGAALVLWPYSFSSSRTRALLGRPQNAEAGYRASTVTTRQTHHVRRASRAMRRAYTYEANTWRVRCIATERRGQHHTSPLFICLAQEALTMRTCDVLDIWLTPRTMTLYSDNAATQIGTGAERHSLGTASAVPATRPHPLGGACANAASKGQHQSGSISLQYTPSVFQLTYSGSPLNFEHSEFGNPPRDTQIDISTLRHLTRLSF